MKKTLVLIFVFILSLVGLNAKDHKSQNKYGKQKAVYHINYDDAKRQKGALINIQNHINAVGSKNLEIRVVLHGNGLSMLLYPDALEELTAFKNANASDNQTARIDGLKNQGVKFFVCRTTITSRNVNVEDHLHDVYESSIVPSGVAEVAHLQHQGFAYIRP